MLVVDDNDTNRRVIGELLAGADFEVEMAASAIEALSVLQRAAETGTPFQAVVTDHRMPGIDGLELARRIRATRGSRRLRLVLYSSIDDRSSRQELRELGFRRPSVETDAPRRTARDASSACSRTRRWSSRSACARS